MGRDRIGSQSDGDHNVIPLTPQGLGAAATNLLDRVVTGHLADTRPMPRVVIDEGPQRTVYRYAPRGGRGGTGLPVLLVPPLAAPAICFDLRRGCSVAEHLLSEGRRTYLVDYGSIAFSDRDLGLEHWIDEVVPKAVEAVSRDAGGAPVILVGWCLGGIFALLAAADRKSLPIAAIAAIATPFDVGAVPTIAPLRPLANLTGGRLLTGVYRALGGAPAPIVRRAFQLSSVDKMITKPLAIAMNLHDRESLAQIEAVDRFTDNMLAYPGRTFGQLYHRFFRANDLAGGHLDIAGRRILLENVRVPVLIIAGESDVLAPKRAVHRLTRLLPNAPRRRYRVCPGGHLGVLTGRGARHGTWKYLDEFIEENTAPKPARKPTPARKPAARSRPTAARRSG
ncbi:MAG: alpha/beta fold hydrolase [Candidatus Dormibacteria bacterium]